MQIPDRGIGGGPRQKILFWTPKPVFFFFFAEKLVICFTDTGGKEPYLGFLILRKPL
jgi:hypothetical protein